jgi:hypothetical protein
LVVRYRLNTIQIYTDAEGPALPLDDFIALNRLTSRLRLRFLKTSNLEKEMKRTTLLIAIIALFVLLLTSNFATRSGASKGKGGSVQPTVAKPAGSAQAAEKRSHSVASARKNRVGGMLADLGTPQTATFTRGGEEADEEEGNDPDRPPGFVGHFDEADYINRREAFIALRRVRWCGTNACQCDDGRANVRVEKSN